MSQAAMRVADDSAVMGWEGEGVAVVVAVVVVRRARMLSRDPLRGGRGVRATGERGSVSTQPSRWRR